MQKETCKIILPVEFVVNGKQFQERVDIDEVFLKIIKKVVPIEELSPFIEVDIFTETGMLVNPNKSYREIVYDTNEVNFRIEPANSFCGVKDCEFC